MKKINIQYPIASLFFLIFLLFSFQSYELNNQNSINEAFKNPELSWVFNH